MRLCRDCRCALAAVKGLCRPCYAYRRKYGRRRPFRVLVAAGERMIGMQERAREPSWPRRG